LLRGRASREKSRMQARLIEWAEIAPGINPANVMCDRHNGGANYTFVDGHAKWLRKTTADMWNYAKNGMMGGYEGPDKGK